MKKWIPAFCDVSAFRTIVTTIVIRMCNYITGQNRLISLRENIFFERTLKERFCRFVLATFQFRSRYHTSIIFIRLFRTHARTGGRADSEGFRRIETRAKSNSVVLPSKLESFNRRRSVRDRAPPPPPLLFRIEYMPFYVAVRPRSVDGKPASDPYRVAF